ncbi:MAG: YvcK family protein [Candidatus Yonathbacteria bacterium]|nr:YvcK family protein [Candidatus Yonathbacteria bacterium]
MKTVVIIGGGTGTFTLLQGLRQFPINNIVIVSTADDGGSTGILRRDLGVMPMGDIRQCLIGLSYTVPSLQKLFAYRFDTGTLKGHNAGNVILAALQKVSGSPEGAIAEAARLLNVRGEVLFVSRQPTTLSAKLSDGRVIKSEHELDEPVTKKRAPIKKLMLSPARILGREIRSGEKAEANPRVLDALARADAIVLGPGDLYTSTFPNLLVPGIAGAIRASQGKKILVTNIMTKLGQTDGFKVSDFVREVNAYLGGSADAPAIDCVLVNTKKPRADILVRYRNEKASFVEPDIEKVKKLGVQVIAKAVISNHLEKKMKGDALSRSHVRHDPAKLAEIIWNLIK